MPQFAASKHDYADVINRIASEYRNDTPGDSLPGVVVEGVITAQESPSAMSTGRGEWPAGDIGWHYRVDSDDMKWYIDRINPAGPGTIEEWVWLVANGVNTRQKMGGHFTDWHAAAYGTTGAVKQDGMEEGWAEINDVQAGMWFDEYKKFVGNKYDEVDALQPGYVRTGPTDTYPKVFSEGAKSRLEQDDDIGDMYRPGYESPGIPSISDVTGAISQYASEWGPRILLFLIGIVVLGIGVWFVVKGKK